MTDLRANLFHRQIGERHIFLDLEADRYFMLEEHSAGRFDRLLNGSADDDDLQWLSQAGISDGAISANAFAAAQIHLPEAEYFRKEREQTSPWLILEAVLAQGAARRQLRRCRFVDTLAMLARRQPPTKDGIGHLADAVAAAFDRSRRFISAADQCLPRSVAMIGVLARHGCRAELVIGVTIPFAAHCWVQHDGVVLSDPLDRIRRFSPIFALS